LPLPGRPGTVPGGGSWRFPYSPGTTRIVASSAAPERKPPTTEPDNPPRHRRTARHPLSSARLRSEVVPRGPLGWCVSAPVCHEVRLFGRSDGSRCFRRDFRLTNAMAPPGPIAGLPGNGSTLPLAYRTDLIVERGAIPPDHPPAPTSAPRSGEVSCPPGGLRLDARTHAGLGPGRYRPVAQTSGVKGLPPRGCRTCWPQKGQQSTTTVADGARQPSARRLPRHSAWTASPLPLQLDESENGPICTTCALRHNPGPARTDGRNKPSVTPPPPEKTPPHASRILIDRPSNRHGSATRAPRHVARQTQLARASMRPVFGPRIHGARRTTRAPSSYLDAAFEGLLSRRLGAGPPRHPAMLRGQKAGPQPLLTSS